MASVKVGQKVWVVMMGNELGGVFTTEKIAKEAAKQVEGTIFSDLLSNKSGMGAPEPDAAAPKKTAKKRDTPAEEEGDDEDEDEGEGKGEEDEDLEEELPAPTAKKSKVSEKKATVTKKAAPKTSKSDGEAFPEGKPGALKGAVIAMTGTACLTRNTLKSAVEKYGGSYTEKCEEADYVVVGKRAGGVKLAALTKAGVAQISDSQLLEFFMGEEPDV
ncbi:hypothetical protein AC579_4126 [Pseudocercospora musae]|uniref:BRCT domain-containing protein n=1 Tax=Pseudocercospora musae TaxID=113226 RepID=A0A139IDU1_9PEZI|nr:hypothetical protein AC579_4126 [Pseudocercospora musae]KXT12924.1 hypothetical protein AC579_4126 [Pseudocercospora musae]